MLPPPPLPKSIPPLPKLPPVYGSPEWAAGMSHQTPKHYAKGARITPPAIPVGSGKGTPPVPVAPVMTPPQAGQIQPTPPLNRATPASTARQVGLSDRPMFLASYGQPARKGTVIGEHYTNNGSGRLMYIFHFADGSADQCVKSLDVFLNQSDANKAGFV